jgi:adenosylcobinamide kinase / adenosylcobinamide-phosphate guanylyltransferase
LILVQRTKLSMATLNKKKKQSITLVTGGVKSGKSAFALQLGTELSDQRAFIATATALDDEMARKIAAHRAERGELWQTTEEPRDIAAVLERRATEFDVVLIDCLTLWVSNMLTLYDFSEDMVADAVDNLLSVLQKAQCRVIIVTNEVGLGILPADSLSRSYQKLLGAANKRLAEAATSVLMMIAGIPVKIK